MVIGCKAGGHLGFAEQDLFSGTCQTLDEILPEVLAEVKAREAQFGHSIPVFVAGGVYTGAVGSLYQTGAAGVQLPPALSPPTSAMHPRGTRTFC